MNLTIILLLSVPAAAALVGWLWARARTTPTPEAFLAFRCPGCGQKVRYRASRAGRPGLCPRCKRPALLPVNPPVLRDRRGTGLGVARVGRRRW